jgi:hypothetical protein
VPPHPAEWGPGYRQNCRRLEILGRVVERFRGEPVLREQKTAEQKTELYRSRSPLVRADGAPYHFIANRCIVLAITIGSHVSIGTRKRTLKTCTGNNYPPRTPAIRGTTDSSSHPVPRLTRVSNLLILKTLFKLSDLRHPDKVRELLERQQLICYRSRGAAGPNIG